MRCPVTPGDSLRAMGRRIGWGLLIGLLIGLTIGLIMALLLHKHAHAFWGWIVYPAVFGLFVGGLVGGMLGLSNPAPGEEPMDSEH
jgi:hypothetical protein